MFPFVTARRDPPPFFPHAQADKARKDAAKQKIMAEDAKLQQEAVVYARVGAQGGQPGGRRAGNR